MSNPITFHTVVIGAGSGGLTVAVGLAGFGKQVAVIERAKIGGDCTNVGCIPSKTLIHLAREVRHQGLSPEQVLARVRERRDTLQEREERWIEGLENVTLIRGHARLTGHGSVAVAHEDGAETTLEAHHIVLATGSRPATLAIEGLPPDKLLTNESLFDLGRLPSHLAIVGAGAIGSEMAFAFRHLGAKVSLIDMAPRVLATEEPEVSDVIARSLRQEGIELHLGASVRRYRDGALVVERDGVEVPIEGVDRVLLAVGRLPNVANLGLEQVGIAYDRGGIASNAWGRTSVANIYAVGDIGQRSRFTHTANNQGRRLVQKLALPWVPLGREPAWPSAVFTDPEAARVGPTLAQLKARYHSDLIVTKRIDLAATDRGYTMGLSEGFVLLHAMRLSGRLLAATVVAPAASEMIPLLTLALQRRLTVYALANLVFPYPVLSEAVKKAADAFVFATLPRMPQEAATWLRRRFASPAAALRSSRHRHGIMKPD